MPPLLQTDSRIKVQIVNSHAPARHHHGDPDRDAAPLAKTHLIHRKWQDNCVTNRVTTEHRQPVRPPLARAHLNAGRGVDEVHLQPFGQFSRSGGLFFWKHLDLLNQQNVGPGQMFVLGKGGDDRLQILTEVNVERHDPQLARDRGKRRRKPARDQFERRVRFLSRGGLKALRAPREQNCA